MSAEAMRQDEPRWGELVTLMGWPWKLALALAVSGAALVLLPHTGFVAPLISARTSEVALACLASAALLALTSGLHTLRALLRSAAEEPPPASLEAPALINGLLRLLEEQRLQVHETAGVASRAVATAAQFSGLASQVEKQFRQTLEEAASAAASSILPTRLEAALEKLEDALPVLVRMEESSRRIQHSASGLAEVEGMLQALPAAAERMDQATGRLERAGRVLERLPESMHALCAATQGLTEQSNAARLQGAGTGQRMEELVRSLGTHVERIVRNEADLGDAARYLTETTDRFAAGLAALETHAVRLQAMVSIGSQREMEISPLRDELSAFRQQVETLFSRFDAIQRQWGGVPTLPPGLSATLERLGAMEADAAQLLQEAGAMSPPALASRSAKLLRSVQENLRHLQATTAGPSKAA